MSYREKNFYERICEIFGKIRINPPKNLEKKYREEIAFTNLMLEPYQVFSTAIFLPLIIFIILSLISILLNLFYLDLIFSFALLSAILFYFFYNYTSFLVKYVRAKASSEMVLSIVYMAISLRINQNLEKAVEFTAENLSGPIGEDFKIALYNISSGKSYSIKEELSKIAEKWKVESQEFSDAISILEESTQVTKEELERNLKEAIEIVMVGTKRRMKDYALKIKTPVTIVNSFGILLPLLVMVFLPIGLIFLPQAFRQATIVTMYNFVLPSVIYMLLLQNFYSRPYSYHQVTLNKQEDAKRKKIFYAIPIFLTSSLLIGMLFYLLQITENIDFKFLYSLFIIDLISFSAIIYFYSISKSFEAINQKIVKFEEELPSALYQMSMIAQTGKPLEIVFEELSKYSKILEISEMFRLIVENLKKGIFSLRDSAISVLKKYPSKILESCIKSILDISQKGSFFASESLKSISSYLDDAKEVNKFTDEVLSETTSEMKITSLIFAPLIGGIMIGMTSMMVLTFNFMKPYIESSLQEFSLEQVKGLADIAGWLFNLNKQIPLEYFQIVIGFYVFEVTLMLSWFLGEMSYGEDENRKFKDIAKTLFIGVLIYSFISIGLYSFMRFALNIYLVIPR